MAAFVLDDHQCIVSADQIDPALFSPSAALCLLAWSPAAASVGRLIYLLGLLGAHRDDCFTVSLSLLKAACRRHALLYYRARTSQWRPDACRGNRHRVKNAFKPHSTQ
jgi:hypothetical protein